MKKCTRITELTDKVLNGSATECEQEELLTIMDEFAKKRFAACPVCGGSFSLLVARIEPFNCPNCDCTLTSTSYDCISHQRHEIDSSFPKSIMLGEYFTRYVPKGCTVCYCGELYPTSYSCCPELLVLANSMTLSTETGSVEAGISFLDRNQLTLINCLRGRFNNLFDLAALRHLLAISGQLTEPETIREIVIKTIKMK